MDLLNTDTISLAESALVGPPLGSKIANPETTGGFTYKIHTYGCKVNSYDSGLLSKRLNAVGSTSDSSPPQVHILNTCAVTGEATKEAIRQVRKLKMSHPESLIVVTGCSAQVDTEKIMASQFVDVVVANSHKGDLNQIIKDRLTEKSFARLFKSNIFKKEDLEEGGGLDESHTRAFLKIQDGCNSFCTFCVIPFARGKSRSLSIIHLRERVKELISKGIKEIVLTGVHIGDYEFGLENLIEDLLLYTRVSRLRLTSLEPIEVSERLLELFQDPRLCPHFHMSIQSGATSVLTGMKRKYSAEDVARSLKNIEKQVPRAFVGMDVIAGFPGEGDQEFFETYDLLSNLPWTRMHVFSYSERPGTYATRLPQKNDLATIRRRSDQLRTLSRERYEAELKKQIGDEKKVLVLNADQGLSRDYWSVHFEEAIGVVKNQEQRVKIIGIKPHKIAHLEPVLIARPIDLPQYDG